MGYPLKKKLRAFYGRRLLGSLAWAAFWLALWLGGIEYFYGPGKALWTGLWDGAPYLLGAACAAAAMGVFISLGYLIARLAAFLTWSGGLRRSMARYLPEGRGENPWELLERDIRCQLADGLDLYLGCDWILFAGKAMRRDDVAGVYREDLSKRYLSRKVRLQLVDVAGRSICLDLSRKQAPLYVYGRLVDMHPQAVHGDGRIREGVGAIAAYQLSREARQEASDAPLGLSRWDKSPILEENHVRCDYERWLLASYCLYIADDPYRDGDFAYAGGYERTALQRTIALEVLEDSWEVRTRAELLGTVRHLVSTGRSRRDGWQLGRATMVLGFGYIGELISREELLEYSLEAALAIQETFPGWEALFDSHMEGFAAWSKKPPAVARRRRVYRELRKNPASPLNTVPFQSDLRALYNESRLFFGGGSFWDTGRS
mgnify:CR=1 FL=1